MRVLAERRDTDSWRQILPSLEKGFHQDQAGPPTIYFPLGSLSKRRARWRSRADLAPLRSCVSKPLATILL